MQQDRRQFLRVGSVGLASTAIACGGPSDTPSSQAPATPAATPAANAAFSLTMQFFGLVMHGSWKPGDPTKPHVVPGWEVLLVRQKLHVPRLRIALASVTNPVGYEEDPLDPRMGIWNLKNTDVIVRLNDSAGGTVTGVTGKRPVVNGVPAKCPNSANKDEFLDITWMPHFSDLLKLTGPGYLRAALKGASKDIKKDDLLGARVRLSAGSMACARPSMKPFEEQLFEYAPKPYDKFQPQFHPDIVRFTSTAADRIDLELVPFGSTSGPKIALTNAQSPVVAFVENVDPNPLTSVLKGHVTEATYWKEHFDPYYELLDYNKGRTYPKPGCCKVGCDPPYYCVESRGEFA